MMGDKKKFDETDKEFKNLYDNLIYQNRVKFDEVFAAFYDVMSKDQESLIYVEPIARINPHLIRILEKYFNLKKIYYEDDEGVVWFSDDEPEENMTKTLSFIGCKEKREQKKSSDSLMKSEQNKTNGENHI